MSWSELSHWWISELRNDPAYEEIVTPLLIDVLGPETGRLYLDLGCGEGRVMRAVARSGADVIGLDINLDLIRGIERTVAADVPSIPMRRDSFDGAYSVLALEHIEDHEAFFNEAARVVKSGGILAIVINHPVWTAPDSTPVTDSDGEVLWRPGEYFSQGSSEVPAGESTVTFHHRSMSDLLNAAATTGWSLGHMIERPHHEYGDQAGIPRLLACRWRRLV